MPLDAICLQAVVEELRPQLLNLRIDKAQQPARDQVILLLRGNKRLLLNAGANAPRIQLTETARDNPAEPPMFCMLLRKHLVGARVADITQPLLERLVRLELDITDDFGQPGKRTLVLEAMGRRSNLILLDGEGRIIDCMRRVDADMSAQRQVLPGLYYEPPASVGRLPVTEESEEGFRQKLAAANPERQLDAFLLDSYFGISPLMARELAFRTAGASDARLLELNETGRTNFWREIYQFSDAIKENKFTPIMLKKEGSPEEFACFPILQYGGLLEPERFDSFSALLDSFYEQRERQERVRQRGADLIRTATTARDRLRRKLAMQEKDYAATQDRDRLRICGDLITSNLYRMERGQSKLVCENFYDENCAETTIQLDPLLTPQQNAAKYYKRYTKAKTAEKYLREQMEFARRDAEYLESVLEEISHAISSISAMSCGTPASCGSRGRRKSSGLRSPGGSVPPADSGCWLAATTARTTSSPARRRTTGISGSTRRRSMAPMSSSARKAGKWTTIPSWRSQNWRRTTPRPGRAVMYLWITRW